MTFAAFGAWLESLFIRDPAHALNADQAYIESVKARTRRLAELKEARLRLDHAILGIERSFGGYHTPKEEDAARSPTSVHEILERQKAERENPSEA